MTRLPRRTEVGVVAAAVVVGLVRLGPLREERSRRLDKRRVEDLRRIADNVDLYWTRQASLPPSLDRLSTSQLPSVSITDPASGDPYDYAVIGRFDSERSRRVPNEFWSHPAGRYYFELDGQDVRCRPRRP